MVRITLLLSLLLSLSTTLRGQNFSLEVVDRYIDSAITQRYFPGAQLVIGNKEGVYYSKSYGYLDYTQRTPVDESTIYDLASCTKVLATTLATMTLIEEGKISLDTKIGDVIEGADTLEFADVMVKNLLYHESGFRPGVGVSTSLVRSADKDVPLLARSESETNPYLFDTRYYVAKNITYDSTYVHGFSGRGGVRISKNHYLDIDNYRIKLDSMITAAYNPKRKGYYTYSDLNIYFLQKIIEKVTATSLDKYIASIYQKMNISTLGFNPKKWYDIEKIAPTEFDPLFRRDTVRGVVHDELAFVQGGVCGNAGLFGSAQSVAEICGMFLRGGTDYHGNKVVNNSTIDLFTRPKKYSSGAFHGLGFDKLDPNKFPYPSESYGHTGFTGTYFWIDPTSDLYVILLTNRINPSRTNRNLNGEYRSKMWEMIERINHNNQLYVER
ncbi:MAG: serine hydrolase [Rikenellaceae bacterium]